MAEPCMILLYHRLIRYFHVHFSNLWQAFASHGPSAIAKLLIQFNELEHMGAQVSVNVYRACGTKATTTV